MGKDFIIEKNVLIAYVGDNTISKIVIPDGVKKIGKEIFQEKMTAEKLIIKLPTSIKDPANYDEYCNYYFNAGTEVELVYKNKEKIARKKENKSKPKKSSGIDYVKINRDFNSSIETGDYSNEYLAIPNGVCSINTSITAKVVLVPKTVDPNYFSKINAEIYLFEHPILNATWVPEKANYVFEGIEYASVKYVNAIKSKGYNYLKTNKGLIVSEFNIDIAKFSSIPEKLEGQKVLALNKVDLLKDFPGKETEFVDDNTKLKDELKGLYPLFKYQKKQLRDKVRDTIYTEKTRLNEQREFGRVDDPCTEETIKGDAPAIYRFPISLILALIFGGFMFNFLINSYPDGNGKIFTSIFFTVILFFIAWIILGIIKYAIICAIDKAREEKRLNNNVPLITYSDRSKHHRKIQKAFPEGLYLKVIRIYRNEIADYAKNVKEENENNKKERSKEIKEFWETTGYSSSNSYTIYDNNGNQIGKIDKD